MFLMVQVINISIVAFHCTFVSLQLQIKKKQIDSPITNKRYLFQLRDKQSLL